VIRSAFECVAAYVLAFTLVAGAAVLLAWADLEREP
jgi:hypothetical protein